MADGDPANLMYFGVLAVGIIGALIARFKPRGMARALIAMALAQALILTIALIARFGGQHTYPAALRSESRGPTLSDGTIRCAYLGRWRSLDNYQQQLADAVGDRPAFEVLQESLVVLPGLIDGVEAAVLHQRPSPRDWSVREILCHLVDAEFANAVRMRMVLTEDRPLLIDFAGEAWVERFSALYGSGMTGIMELWTTLRRANLAVYESISGEELAKVGVTAAGEAQPMSLLLKLRAGHDLMHIAQMRETLGVIGEAGPT